MRKRIREFFESIAFAGLKPDAQSARKRELKWFQPIERILSGSAPSDPLYLSNRTAGQKWRSWSLIAIPCLVLAVGVWVAWSNLISLSADKPFKAPTKGEITAKLLPKIDKDFQLKPPSDLQVPEIRIVGSRLVGVLKNTSAHEIATAEVVVDLTNTAGSQVGAVSAVVLRVPAMGSKDFQIPIAQRDAAFGLVREVKSR